MSEALAGRYWCHVCSQRVNPVMEVEIKCPFCEGGFVEEMGGITRTDQDHDFEPGSDRTDRALSLWAPIFLGMMSPSSRRRRLTRDRHAYEDENQDSEEEQEEHEPHRSIIRRRRRSAAILQLFQGLRNGIGSESENNEAGSDSTSERERVILINPFNQAIILRGSFDLNQNSNNNQNGGSIGASLGDYFIGPGLDLLLQHLAENDPSRYGTPPAQKEAIEAMPKVKVCENLRCSVCIEDFEIGEEAREMPCKHRFHDGCILPWLELHSSCPICRFQMPAVAAVDGSKEGDASSGDSSSTVSNTGESSGGGGNSTSGSGGGGAGGSTSGGGGGGGGAGGSTRGAAEGGNNRRFGVSIPWPLTGLFSSSGGEGSQTGDSNSSASTSASNSQANEN